MSDENQNDEKQELDEALGQQKVLLVSALFMEYAKDPEKFKEELTGFFVDVDSSEGKLALLLRNLGVVEMTSIANHLHHRDFKDLELALEELNLIQGDDDDPLEGEEKVLAFITILNSLTSQD